MANSLQRSDGNEPDVTRMFISYSRSDLPFASELRDRLVEAGFEAFLDVHDIVKGEPWRDRLSNLILNADAMVFIISPSSVTSEICEWEVNEAELHEKRLFPVVAAATDDDTIPQRLRRLNLTSLESAAGWEDDFPKLLSVLAEDAIWVREHTRLGCCFAAQTLRKLNVGVMHALPTRPHYRPPRVISCASRAPVRSAGSDVGLRVPHSLLCSASRCRSLHCCSALAL